MAYEAVDNMPEEAPAEEAKPKINVKRRYNAMKSSYKALRSFRENRLDFVKEYTGPHYGDAKDQRPIPMPIIAQGIGIYTRSMFAKNPRALFRTPYQALKPMAMMAEIQMDKLLKRINFKREADMYVVNAMLGVGIMKVGLNDTGSVNIDGVTYPWGEPYAMNVDFDDWVHDTCARTWTEVSFMGNRYRVPLEDAKKNELFDPVEREKLKASAKDDYSNDEDKVSELSEPEEKENKDEYEDYVDLVDLYYPREGIIVTLPWGKCPENPLRVVEWTGPKSGPYIVLTYQDVPNNVLGVPPVAQWLDSHELLNSLIRKLSRQAQRSKHVFGVRAGGDKDADRIIKAKDGDMVKVDDAQHVAEMRYDGPDGAIQTFSTFVRDYTNFATGNLESLGGLGAQSETLGQDQLIAQSNSKQLDAMKDRTAAAIQQVIEALAYLMWTDPLMDYPVSIQIPGTGLEIEDTLTAQERAQADFMMFNIEIDPYSMQDNSPQTILQSMQGFLQMMVPNIQFMQMQGIDINWEAVATNWARYTGTVPEMRELLTYARPPMDNHPQEPQQPPKPANTTRTYVRKNVAGKTADSKQAMMQKMMTSGGEMQSSEMSAALR